MNTTSSKPMCIKCKSFFASMKEFCSVCYQVALKNNEITIPETKDIIITEKKEEKVEVVPEQPKQQVRKDVCWKCEKRVGYLGFTCRCTYTFCNLHRHFNDHDCSFDYKSMERERLKKDNPLVASKKI